MSRSTRLIASLLFGSGLSALVYQTAWQRMLRLVFGASTAATAAVLAIFLGGLGLGAAYFGKRIEKSERPLSYYGNLEAGVALAAALTPGSAWLAARIYFGLGGSVALGAWGAGAVRLVLSTMVLGPAVVLMGGTLPAAARAVETQDDFARSRLATLYAANTAGAVAGTLLSTFVLFEVYGTRLSLWSAALLNLLVALLARRFGRVAAPVPVSEPESAEDSFEAGVAFESRKVPAALVYAVAAGSGFAFLSLELVWYRMLAPILGGSSFTFGLILAVALAGIGLGGWFYALRDRGRFATPSLLAITLALEALAIGIPLALGDKIAIYAAYTRPMAALGFWALVLSWTFSTAV
ncbi:MAG TPA: hypothetical protein VGJ84_03765, partial [Polyangiaceae bacterium]